MSNPFTSHTLQYWRENVAEFIEQCLINPETNEPFKLLPAERLFIEYAFQLDSNGRLVHRDWIYGTPKKGGKSGFGALLELTVILLFGSRFAEGYCVANDLEQATGRVFQMCQRIVEATPWLKAEANVTQKAISFPASGSSIVPLASDYGSAAGGHPVISVIDEPWAVTSERGYRLYDELIPVPTKPFSVRMMVTHAGFENESTLLFDIYKRGLQQPMVAPDLYSGDGLLMYWTNLPVAPWQDAAWFADCRRSMRPNQYARMCENRWVRTENTFIDMTLFDEVVDPLLSHRVADKSLICWAAVDASWKHDSTALALFTWDAQNQRVVLCDHRIFVPSREQPINFSIAVEQVILDWHNRFSLQAVWYDPMQMVAVAQALARQGVTMFEYPQTVPNLTRMAENLHSLIKGRNILFYRDAEIRTAISQSVAEEKGRG